MIPTGTQCACHLPLPWKLSLFIFVCNYGHTEYRVVCVHITAGLVPQADAWPVLVSLNSKADQRRIANPSVFVARPLLLSVPPLPVVVDSNQTFPASRKECPTNPVSTLLGN
jgi:hypothetical protein